MGTSCLDQARPQQGFWLGKSLDSTKEDGGTVSEGGGGMKLLQNYLAGWKQRACVGEEKWEWTDVKMGVPQGSILSLLLYAICVNNLPESVEQRQVKHYADDTARFQAADSVSELEVVSRASPLPHEGKGVVNWVFNLSAVPCTLDAALQSEHSIQSWDVAAPNTHLTTKCEIDCHSGSAERKDVFVA